jgi:hypothetical protein
MYQRRRILDIWEAAGLRQSGNPAVLELIRFVEQEPNLDWAGFVDRARRDHAAAISLVVPPLMASGDNLIITNLLRHANPRSSRDRDIVRTFVREADPVKHLPALMLVAKTGSDALKAELAARPGLPAKLRQVLVEAELPRGSRLGPERPVTRGTPRG